MRVMSLQPPLPGVPSCRAAVKAMHNEISGRGRSRTPVERVRGPASPPASVHVTTTADNDRLPGHCWRRGAFREDVESFSICGGNVPDGLG